MFTIKQNGKAPVPEQAVANAPNTAPNCRRFPVRPGMTLAVLFLYAIASAPHAFAQTSPAPRGVYLYSWDIANGSCAPGFDSQTCTVSSKAIQLAGALQVNGIDGLTLVLDWSVVEPRMYSYIWGAGTSTDNYLDSWIQFAASAGKKVNLAIRSGGGNTGFATPSWLFQEGHATPLMFYAAAHQGQGNNCVKETIAAPWDIQFQAHWQAMLYSLATHLRTTPALNGKHELDFIQTIRLTGVNRTTDEFRLPEELPATLTACGANPINSIQTWLNPPPNTVEPYRPKNLFNAWTFLVDAFNGAFPGKQFNLPIIPNGTGSGDGSGVSQNPFPEIDDGGCVYNPPINPAAVSPTPCAAPVPFQSVDQNAQLLQYASRVFADRLTLEFESLNTSSAANPYTVGAADWLNAGAAFMTNDWLGGQPGGGGAGCTGGPGTAQPCVTAAEYFSLIQRGIYLSGPNNPGFRAQFLEVFYTDVLRTDRSGPPLACAIWQAHVDLTDYTAPVTFAAISGQQTVNGWYRGPVTVSFTASDSSTTGQPAACSPLTIATRSSVDGGPWQAGNSISINSAGVHTVVFQSMDTAGNLEPSESITIKIH